MTIKELKQKQIERFSEFSNKDDNKGSIFVESKIETVILDKNKLETFLKSCQQEIIDKVKEEIEKKKLIEACFPGSQFTLDWKKGHNQALKDILNIIK